MIHRKRLILAGGLSVAMLLASPLALAQTATEADSSQEGTNVVIHFNMGTLEGKKRTTTKSYTLVVAAGSMGSQLLAGQRVPFDTGGPVDVCTTTDTGIIAPGRCTGRFRHLAQRIRAVVQKVCFLDIFFARFQYGNRLFQIMAGLLLFTAKPLIQSQHVLVGIR